MKLLTLYIIRHFIIAVIFFSSLAITCNQKLHANHIPESHPVFFEGEATLRGIVKLNEFTFMADFTQRMEGSEKRLHYRSLNTGFYYRFLRHLKGGFFYRVQAGALHDDDWISLSPGWKWRDTERRDEHLVFADITPRFPLPVFNRRLIADIKTRYFFNTYNLHHTITVRPGITWFWMDGITPFMNFSIRYEAYFPLNYSKKTLYEQWVYLNSLYHFNDTVKIGISLSYRERNWTPSRDFRESHPGEGYLLTDRSVMLGLSAVFIF